MAGARSTNAPTRLSAARQYCTASAGRDGSPLTSTLAFPLLAAPRAGAPGKRSGTDITADPDRSEATADFVGVAQTPTGQRTADHWLTPSKHRSTTSGTSTKQQPALSADQPKLASRPTRSTEPLLHASPPRLTHSLQALEHFLAVSQSPKWPPRTQLSVVVSWG